MPNCIVSGCHHKIKTGYDLPPDVGFHRLPRQPELRSAWLTAVNRPDLLDVSYRLTICSIHFDEDSFEPSSQLKVELMGQKRKRCLRNGAVPTRNLVMTNQSNLNGDKTRIKRKRGRPKLNESTEVTQSQDETPIKRMSRRIDVQTSTKVSNSTNGHNSQSSNLLAPSRKDARASSSALNKQTVEDNAEPNLTTQTTDPLSSPSTLPASCCQVILDGMDSMDTDQQSMYACKQEIWEDHSGEAILPDDMTQDHIVQNQHLVQQPEHMLHTNTHMRSFSSMDCLEGVKVELSDPTDLMMLSHARRIRGFSRKRQLQVEMKIAQLVMEAEMEEIEAEDERELTSTENQS